MAVKGLSAPFEPKEKKKYLFVTSCPCTRIIHYTSNILVKIMHLSQLFFHVLTNIPSPEVTQCSRSL